MDNRIKALAARSKQLEDKETAQLTAAEMLLAELNEALPGRDIYWRELERFVLWCLLERRRPMSSVLVDDCEAYPKSAVHHDAEFRRDAFIFRGIDGLNLQSIEARSRRRRQFHHPDYGMPISIAIAAA
ncbi:hypothetical protein [Burkholderia cenocepacia]|uniref:hypothetical protein n=1 Tax=Burkholderia cenocepacia TaxID=95486 RepID=UPI002ABE95D7|nr:hypothetical protein [Burkholderia cenocepacia]